VNVIELTFAVIRIQLQPDSFNFCNPIFKCSWPTLLIMAISADVCSMGKIIYSFVVYLTTPYVAQIKWRGHV
jgi:hypothetical protein